MALSCYLPKYVEEGEEEIERERKSEREVELEGQAEAWRLLSAKTHFIQLFVVIFSANQS